jgi:CheY-like chemotaxis protein
VGLLVAMTWPLVLLVLVVIFLRPIKQLLEREDVEVRGPGGFAISSRNRRAAATALVRASQKEPAAAIAPDDADTEIEVAASGVERLPRVPRVLWVDDRPSNNRYERTMLHALGMYVDLSTSTDEALAKVTARGAYDVIISDMGRPPDEQAGYTLLAELRRVGVRTPFIIYAASRDPAHFDESVRRGADGCTNRPDELVELVTNALRSHDQR